MAQSAAAAPVGAKAPVSQAPFHLSCPSATLCVAVDGAGHALVSTHPAGGAAAWRIEDIDGSNRITGVSCPSGSMCVAVDVAGHTLVSTHPAGGAAAWRTTNVEGATRLTGVACPSTGLCVAVGGRDVAVSTEPAGGSSSWKVLPNLDDSVGPECGKYGPGEGCAAALVSISCSSVSLCVGLDNWGQVISSSDPAGGWGAWSRGGRAQGPDLTAMSCSPGSSCVGVCSVGFGLLGQDCPGTTYGDSEAVTWAPGERASGADFSTIAQKPLSSMWCAPSACFAAGDDGRLLATTDQNGSRWSTILNPANTRHAYDPIEGVSCPAVSTCVAIDRNANVFAAASRQPNARVVAGSAARTRPALPRFHRTATLATAPYGRRRRPGKPLPPLPLSLRAAVGQAGPGGHSSTSPHARRALATTASTVGYGLATTAALPSNTTFATCTIYAAPCPAGDLQGWFNRTSPNSFSTLRSALPLTYARFSVPYDALSSWNGQACVASPTSSVGRQDFAALVWEVQAAQVDNLTPVVTFTNGTGSGGVPSIPDPSYGTAGRTPFGGWTPAAYDYQCGVRAIMQAIGTAGIGSNPVVDWEAWNEPNGAPQFNGALANECNSSSSPCGGVYNSGSYLCYSDFTACGPLEAAGLWEIAHNVAQAYFGSRNFQIAAMTVSDAQNSPYETSYIQAIQSMAQCASGYYCSRVGPSVWSIHDYDGPSSGVPTATANIKRFATTLNSHWATNQTVWVTEAGVALEDGATSDNNCKTSSSNCGSLKSSNCAIGVYPSLDNKFGACADGSPSNQSAGAGTFLNLAAAAATDTQNVTQVDWYEFQAPNASTGWDSGLVSPPAGTYSSPNGTYTASRASLCVLDGVSTSQCSASAVDATDWSTNEYQAAHP